MEPIRIGIVGAAGKHTATSTVRRNVRGLTFSDPAPEPRMKRRLVPGVTGARALNKASMSKFGVQLGEVTLSFTKR